MQKSDIYTTAAAVGGTKQPQQQQFSRINREDTLGGSGGGTPNTVAAAAAADAAATARLNAISEGKMPSSIASSAPFCRFYFLQGSCRNGENCLFSHSLPENQSYEETRGQIPCPYFAKGCCRYGDYCQLRHDLSDLRCKSIPISGGVGSVNDSGSATTGCGGGGGGGDHAAICGICLDDVRQVGHKFGVLSCCKHVFCFECLMEWRKEGSEEAVDRRSCPACRKKSDWVIPSTVMPTTDEEKDRIATQYKVRLGRIPCKHFDGTLGSCPYGRDCFYAHISTDDGLDCKAADRSMKELYEQRRQHRNRRRLESDIEMISRAMLLMDLYAYRGLGNPFDEEDFWNDDDNNSEDEEEEEEVSGDHNNNNDDETNDLDYLY